jgi:hypothetical protein
MKKSLVTVLSAFLLASAPVAVPAQSLGLARSENPFSVVRLENLVPALPRVPFTLRPGDRVKSGDGAVMVQGLKGESILLGPDSETELRDGRVIRLHGGAVALSLPKNDHVDLEVADLRIEPMEWDEGSDAPGKMAVAMVSADEIRLMTDGNMVRILNSRDGKQLASMGRDEVMRFVRDAASGEWVPGGLVAQFEGDPTNVEDGDRRKGGLIGFLRSGGGGGGAAAGGATAAAVAGGVTATGAVVAAGVTTTQSDSNDDTERDEMSPEQPPEEEPYFEEEPYNQQEYWPVER